MPLRDHFRPPVSKHSSWEGFHGYWPGAMVWELAQQLPQEYVAEPRVHLGSFFEIDVSTYADESGSTKHWKPEGTAGSTAATYAPPAPTLAIDGEISQQYEYEVHVYDVERERKLVAAVEIVSPANKDRPENRQIFVAKCASLLQKGVCVSIIDPVTIRRANLYSDLLALIGKSDPNFGDEPPATYAVTCRQRHVKRQGRLEFWSHELTVGKPLPDLPIWLTDSLAVSLNLEASYEETCRVLRIV